MVIYGKTMPASVKKLLLVSCSTGAGHFRAAEALRLSCQKLYPNVQVLHIDLADYLSGFARAFSVTAYNSFAARIPKVYKFIYFFTDRPLTQKFLYFIKPFLRLGAKKFLKKVTDYAPDYIISTHFAPQLLLPKNPDIPLDAVITDYHVHRIWLAPNIRNFFVASEETRQELEALNIKSLATGIPVYPDFIAAKDVNALKTKLGLNNNWPTVLIMPISRGEVDAKKAVKAIFSLEKNINVVAITGANDKKILHEFEEIKKSSPNFMVLEHTKNIDEWMRVADVIISKAGGLTITEAIYLQKPLLIANPIPGQEDYNTAYLEKNRYGLKANSADDLAEKICRFCFGKIEHPRFRPQSKSGQTTPNASEIILKNIL